MSFNMSLNTTEPPPHTDASKLNTKNTRIALSLLSVLISVIGLFGNGIIISYLCRRANRNKSTVYILNLAVADFIFLVGCGSVAVYLLCLLNGVQTADEADKVFSILMDLVNNFGFNASLFLLATLSTERCLSGYYPIWYRCRRPRHLSAVVCVVMWTLSLLITVLEKFVFEDYRSTIYIITSVLYVIVTIIMIMTSSVLLWEICRSSSINRPVRLYIAIIAAVILFLVSLVPARLMRLLFFFVIIPTGPIKVLTYFVVSLCSAVNSCFNPYIYILVGRWRNRSSMKLALHGVFKEEIERSSELCLTTG
ncbi:mas-related G-protein coupled receptor member H-like [Spea bombifrons]|uniref:mas-related G-protein coupled receptor member H-like n=1 Tax=Spea bombifrons TaxID=233779 RepID=UPI002348EF55|nr:mas-related G-protein coupled receptor member H-like [Spea bombifrons]